MRTHYDNLKVLRNAPPEVIRAAYKVLCQKYHPDKFPGNSQSAERVMKILNAAYAVLSDAEKKEAYNKFLAEVEVQARQDYGSAWQNYKPQPDAQQESRRHDDDAEAKPRNKPYASGWQTSHKQPRSESLSKRQLAWRRFFARSLDYSCGNLVVIGILGLVALVGRWNLDAHATVIYPMVLSMIPALVWMPIEVGIAKSFGSTPGKKLFGLRLICDSQHPEHGKRALMVWVRGMGLGLPIVSWITAAVEYSRLKKTALTSWDKDYGFTVEAESMGFEHWFIASTALLFSFILVIAGYVLIHQGSVAGLRDPLPTQSLSNIHSNPQPIPLPLPPEFAILTSSHTEAAHPAFECNPLPTAIARLTQCAEQGDAKAQGILGKAYREGAGGGVPKDNALAYYWVRKAALQGVAREQYNLAILYYEGKGVGRDSVLALYWLHEAIKQGDAKAQSKLGRLYAEGQDVPQDYAEAAKWYRLAADQGDAEAQARLKQLVRR